MGDWTKGGTTGHHTTTRAEQGGAPPQDEAGREISRPTDAGRAGIWPEKTTTAASVCRRIFRFFGHFKPPHSSFPPFLDPLNSFPWSLFADSSPFRSYDENKVGRRLDRVFRPPQPLLDKVMVLMSSWSLGLSIDMWFVNFGRRLVSFPFLSCFG